IFFFQAEDGIRDYKVTGVQTCALPICQTSCIHSTRERSMAPKAAEKKMATADAPVNGRSRNSARSISGLRERSRCTMNSPIPARSEERRVGKECRSRGEADKAQIKEVR